MAKKKIHIEKRLDKDNLIVDVQFVKGSIAPE
jgi:hypothetical protein